MFQRRNCPLCNSSSHRQVLRLTAKEIVEANWSYRSEMLGAFPCEVPETFDIVQCDRCAFVFAGLLPPSDFLAFVYDELIDVEAARRESYCARGIARRMSDLSVLLMLLGDNGRVLDYGCGFGSALRLLGSVHGVTYVGYDNSVTRVGELRESLSNVTLDLGDVQRRGPYSAIILDNVLEHVGDPHETALSLRRMCGPRAILYVSVPDIGGRYLEQQVARKISLGQFSMEINPWEHLNYFDVVHLDKLLSEVGFVAMRQCELPEEPRVGFRPETRAVSRLKNAMASVLRATRYVLTGDALQTTHRRFYKLMGR